MPLLGYAIRWVYRSATHTSLASLRSATQMKTSSCHAFAVSRNCIALSSLHILNLVLTHLLFTWTSICPQTMQLRSLGSTGWLWWVAALWCDLLLSVDGITCSTPLSLSLSIFSESFWLHFWTDAIKSFLVHVAFIAFIWVVVHGWCLCTLPIILLAGSRLWHITHLLGSTDDLETSWIPFSVFSFDILPDACSSHESSIMLFVLNQQDISRIFQYYKT